MILLIDVGNTRIKWARVATGGKLVETGAAPTASLQEGIAAWSSSPRPEQIRAVSVASAGLESSISDWARVQFDLEVAFLRSPAFGNGIVNGYRIPTQLGADRWAAMLGANRRCCGQPFVVVDCGSAVTLDAVGADGRHRGGLILPGLSLSRRALHRGTAQLPLADQAMGALFAADTAAAIGSGTLLGLAASVDALAAGMSRSLGRGARLWITGGDASLLLPYLGGAFSNAPDLVLEGLAVAEVDWR